MRKQFLKELMEQDGDQQANADEVTPDKKQSFKVPEDKEEQKKGVQRFLYLINSIRLSMNTFKSKNTKLVSALKNDGDFDVIFSEGVLPENEPDSEPPDNSEEKKKAQEIAKKYIQSSKAALEYVEKNRKALDSIAKMLNSYYGTIKEAPQIDVASIFAFLQTFEKPQDFENVKDRVLYPGGPSLEQIINIYKYINQARKRQDKAIEELLPFLQDEDVDSPDNIASAPDSKAIKAQIVKYFKDREDFKNFIDEQNLGKLIDLVNAIRVETIKEVESQPWDKKEGLYSKLIDFFSRQVSPFVRDAGSRQNYQEVFLDNKRTPVVDSKKSMDRYVKFLINKKSELETPDPEDNNMSPDDNTMSEQENNDTESAPEPTGPTPYQSIEEFINETDFQVFEKIYFYDLDKYLTKIEQMVDTVNNESFERLKRYNTIAKAAEETGLLNKISPKKVMDSKIELPVFKDGVKGDDIRKMIAQIVKYDPNETNESLMERLIKQELKVLNGKKMVRN